MRTTQAATNWAAAIEGCLLVGLGAMLLRKTWDGQLPLYIHPRYTLLILVTALVLLLIGGFRLWQTGERPQSLRGQLSVYGLLLTPLLLGVLIPAKPAGSSLIDPTQLNNVGRGYGRTSVLAAEDSTKWTLLDWMFARYTLQRDEAKGKPVDVIGFVYHEQGKPADEFYVVRYTLACCVADRSSVSLLVKSADGSALPNDRWVRVTGTIDPQPGEGVAEFHVTNARIELVEQPAQPYLYQ
jgi:uncharacterized repeat protein (TIGR03943 family)